MLALVYVEVPDDFGMVESAVERFVRDNLPRTIREMQFLGDDAEWKTSPLSERPRGGTLLVEIAKTNAQHLVLGRLDELFTHAGTAADALVLLSAKVPHLWVMSPSLHIERGDPAQRLLGALRGLDTTIVNADRLLRKALSQSRRRGLKRPRAARALYGYRLLRDPDGVTHIVEDAREREVMRWIVEQRDVHRRTWEELTAEARKLKIRNRHGKAISTKGLIRRYEAALKLFAEEADQTVP